MSKITVREINAFTRRREQLGDDTHFLKLVARLQEHPELGDVIPGTGGLRKIRMALPGRGSRGGARLIYVWLKETHEIFSSGCTSKAKRKTLRRTRKKR